MSLNRSFIPMEGNQDQSRRADWSYEDDPYGDSAQSIILAQKAYKKKDLRFIQRELNTNSRVTNKANTIYQFANQIHFDRKKNAGQMIQEAWPTDNDKYVDYECSSQDSQEYQVEVDYPSCDDIMSVIDTQKQDGKMYFVVKIKSSRDKNFNLTMQRIKGGGHDVPVLELVQKRDSYYLYRLSFTSQIKSFKINLQTEGKIILSSKNYNFGVQRIEYDIGLSYDLVQDKKLSMSVFEGLMAASNFNVVDQIDFFYKSQYIFQGNNKGYLNQKVEIDQVFDSFLRNQKNVQRLLIMLQAILESPQDQTKKINHYKNHLVQRLARYFLSLMVSYDFKVAQQKIITLGKAQKMIQVYLEVVSIQKVTGLSFDLSTQQNRGQTSPKVSLFIQFLIQNKKLDMVNRYLLLQITHQLKIILKQKGIDSWVQLLRQSETPYDKNYVDLVILFVFYYVQYANLDSIKLVSVLIKAFGDIQFEWNVNGDQQESRKQKLLCSFDNKIAEKIGIPPNNHCTFQQFYKLYKQNKDYDHFKSLFQHQNVSNLLDRYTQQMVKQLSSQDNVQLLEKGIKILVEFCLNQPEKHLEKLSNLSSKILKLTSKELDTKKRCNLVHKLILNSLMKKGQQRLIPIINAISKDLGQIMRKKISYEDTTNLIDDCYDPNIFSNPKIQDSYVNTFLKQIYALHFRKQNAQNIENEKGDFANWHNRFIYKPFINVFLVEGVIKTLCQKFTKKNDRNRNNLLDKLKATIDRGTCPEQQKRHLKAVIDFQNFQLDESKLLKVLTQNKPQLYILKKLKDQSQQQKANLMTLADQLRKRIQDQDLSLNQIINISTANSYQKNLIEHVFSNCREQSFMRLIQEKVKQGSEYSQISTKYRNFLSSLSRSYQLTDYQTIIAKLKINDQNVSQKKLKFRIQILQQIRKVDDKILRTYTFSSFFQGQKNQKVSFSQALEKCKKLYQRIIKNRDLIIQEYEKKNLTYGSIDSFKQQLTKQKQLRQLFLLDEGQNNIDNKDMIKQLLKIFSLLLKIPRIFNALKGVQYFVKNSEEKMTAVKQILSQFSKFLLTIQSKDPKANISKLYGEYQKANKALATFKFSKTSPECLNFEEIKTLQLLEFLYQMSLMTKQNFDLLQKIKPQLDNMKQMCSDDQDNYMVYYEDLQKAEIMINYVQNIFQPNKKSLKLLISQTHKILQKHRRLRLSYEIFKKSNELLKELQNIKSGDKKIIDHIKLILQKCKIRLSFDREQKLVIQICSQGQGNCMTEQKGAQSSISEQDIKKYNNEASLYSTQQSQKAPSQEEQAKTKIYQGFLLLLRKIDEIKKIWAQLQQWGYIIFRQHDQVEQNLNGPLLQKTQMTSIEDLELLIQNNNHEHIQKYLQQKRALSSDWIASIKNLQLISPKAALLQGSGFRDFYQVLTGIDTNKLVSFLSICQAQHIKQFLQIKKLKYEKNPKNAIEVIKQFFAFMGNKNKKQIEQMIQKLGDCPESYLKTAFMNEKQSDFMRGIVELDPLRIKAIDITKILICTDGTTSMDVKAFIQTALRDDKHEYIIMRPQKLSNQNQYFIINQIKQNQVKNKNSTLKLCLVSNSSSETQALYQYLVSNMPRKDLQSTLAQRQRQYKNLILQKTKGVLIVKSQQPGFGKSSFIVGECVKQNRKCIFFPLSGCPTSQSIYTRFQKMCREVYLTQQKQKQKCSLAIQIHHIDQGSYEIVNTFLQQLITGRCIRYGGQLPKLLESTKIFIQLENIQPVNKFNPLLTFSFLKQIIAQNGPKIIKDFNVRPPTDFGLNDQAQIQYIINHLELYDKNQVDTDFKDKNILRFQEFKPKGLDKNVANQLLQKYFWNELRQATFYQYQYFLRLIFEGCKNFTKSYGLSFAFLKDSYDAYYIKTLGLATMRSQFFKVILKNCRQFIKREVEYEQFSYQNDKKKSEQPQMPFLIIPNADGQSFSFVYKDHTKVPAAIRNFYISQSALITRINTQKDLEKLFGQHSLKKLQQTNQAQFDQKISQILYNISGNKNYSIKKDKNYVVNIDNFFKMCLITLRERQKIPITIMGEAGIGKTAIVKHVAQQLYQDQFKTLNINAGTTIQDIRIQLQEIQTMFKGLPPNKKLWVFFDEFNTLKEVGLIKQIFIDKRFEGIQLPFLKQVVMIGACNPFRTLKTQQVMKPQLNVIQEKGSPQSGKKQNLAFHVLPPPHSMLQCMWNFGRLSNYEYEKYIQRMIINVEYKRAQTTKLLLQIHDYLAQCFDASFVSLRDIQRFRTIYSFFNSKLPLSAHKNTTTYAGYDNRQERSLILSLVFCYTLRLGKNQMKEQIYKKIQKTLGLQAGQVEKVKQLQETDFYSRLKVDFGSIAANSAIKQNTYSFFVAIYNKLPMIIVGPPGCSKSLAVRILAENLKGINSQDKYLTGFQSIRSFNFQGSELCTSKQVQDLFSKAIGSQSDKDQRESSLNVIVFDQMGLADNSKDNPLKVIHPYLQVSKDLNLGKKGGNQRNYSFLGISNTDLDLSKMSRMLVLRRAQPTEKQLKQTAVGIGCSFQYGKNLKIALIIQSLSESFSKFVDLWHEKQIFHNFYSLRDFYSLIKYFLSSCQEKQVNINNDKQIADIIQNSIFKNINGMNGSVQLFMKTYCQVTKSAYNPNLIENKYDVATNIIASISRQNPRFPLVIVDDEQSLSYLTNLIINKFQQKIAYFQRSPFINDRQNSQYIIQTTGAIIKVLQKGQKLILNNIQKTIQTSLYDMLNKFYIVRGEENYCSISNVETGLIKKTRVHKNFNCIFFLLTQNLQFTEAPFLSRFQKYKFNLNKIRHAKQIQSIIEDVQVFKKKIMTVCKAKNLNHYKIQNFFQNCERATLRTLVLRAYNELLQKTQNLPHQESEQPTANPVPDVTDQVIFDMVMNSSQDFSMIYQYMIKGQNQIKQYNKIINSSIQKKNTFKLQSATDVILFTTDKSALVGGKQTQRLNKKILQLKQIKQQAAFDQILRQFLHSKHQEYFFIVLQKQFSKYIQYLIAQINKIRQQEEVSKQVKFQNKRIFILFQLNRKYKGSNNQQQRKNKLQGISFLNQYQQIFYEGQFQLGCIKLDPKQFFSKILQLNLVINEVEQFFTIQFKCKNDENKAQLLKKFKCVYRQLSNNKNNSLHRHIQEFIQKTEGTNISINESIVMQVLQNPDFLKQCKNFKQSLTKQLSKKHFYGPVAFFLKHLLQNQTFMTYSADQLHHFNSIQNFSLKQQTRMLIEQAKRAQVYETMLKLITSKKIDSLKDEYKRMKNIKRLPSITRKTNFQIGRARLFHYSKTENQMLLSKDTGCLSQLACKIVSKASEKQRQPAKIQKETRLFRQQLYKKSVFVLKKGQKIQENLYNAINKNQQIKELFMLQLLVDLLQKKGINTTYIESYLEILKLFINFSAENNSSAEKNSKPLDLQHMILTVLAFEAALTLVFKLFQVLFSNKLKILPGKQFFYTFRIRQLKDVRNQRCAQFVTALIQQFFKVLFIQQRQIEGLGGPKQFYQIFTNCMLSIENLQKIMRVKVPTILVSLKDITRFLSEFSQQHKYELLSQYIKKLNQAPKQQGIYSKTFNFIEDLAKKQLTAPQKEIVLRFQANKIFFQWIGQQTNNKDCLKFFISKCESDVTFCHNSMHVINYLFNQMKFDYEDMEGIQAQMGNANKNQLLQIAKYSKEKGFKNNLCVLMVNIFLQKLMKANAGKSHQNIVDEHRQNFIKYYKRLNANAMEVEMLHIFSFAYVKFVLVSYAQLVLKDKIDGEISQVLDFDSDLSNNSRLFCLKIFRKSLTPNQIKGKFIKIKRFNWSLKVEEDFKQNQARSIIVPKDLSCKQLQAVLKQIQESQGAKFASFQAMLPLATSYENRYSILNFFMRYYYSLSYNDKEYRVKTIAHFASIREKFQQKLGKVQTELISRYLNNEVSPHILTKTSQTVNEQDFVVLNFMNLFLAGKSSISPLHSLFLKDGQIPQNISGLIKEQFVLSGVQNPLIDIAQSVMALTRNNNIGVYLCCNECDYMYFHQNCGWPSEQAVCPICGLKIGSRGGHALARDNQGARRLMSKVLTDRTSSFYVYCMAQLPQVWEMQRKYIQVEINRIKLKKQITNKNKQISRFTGLNVVDSGRISSFSFKLIQFLLQTISYLLVSMKFIKPAQLQPLFGLKTQQQVVNKLNVSMKKNIRQIKASLDLGNKFCGWMFGIQKTYIMQLNRFTDSFKAYQKGLVDEMGKLRAQLTVHIQEKKLNQDYINLYNDFVKTIDQGYFNKQVCQVNVFTAQNRFTRDFAQQMFQNLVRTYSGDKKFDFSIQNQSNQGKMQFQFDVYLTQDKIDEQKYNLSRIFKLPDQAIQYHEITSKYEILIKEKYPYLDYILKKNEQFIQMQSFYNLISYVNQLRKQVDNKYERTKGEESLKSFIDQLKEQKGNLLSKKLKESHIMLESWKKLAKSLGVLQNECKVIGKMNDDYSQETQLKGFLLDQSTKQNAYGLMIASIFHNFAKMHNQYTSILNSRKNQIKAYSSLNLFNDLLKIHPQQIDQERVFKIDPSQFKDKLEECSVASIVYGQNFIFNNFDAYQQYFINKLQGKCQIISNLKEFVSVCYNGQAFSAQTQGSAVLAEIRQILDKKLSKQSLASVNSFIKQYRDTVQFQKKIVQVRGDLEIVMLTLNTLKGNYSKELSCKKIIEEIQIPVKSQQLRREELSSIPVSEIFDLYQTLENEFKHVVLKKLPQKYKAKFDKQNASNVQNYLKNLPMQPCDDNLTVQQLQSAIIKFTSRTLQNGIVDAQKKLLEFVLSRADFWPKQILDQKTQMIGYDPTMSEITIAYVFGLLQIIEKVKIQHKNQ